MDLKCNLTPTLRSTSVKHLHNRI